MYCKRVRQITVSLALAAVAASVMFFCSPSNPYLPNERITAVITAHITGPLYQGNFYKGYLPITDFVVWIEDENSRYIKTLQVSKGAVNVASSGVHAEHLPIWAKSANVKCDLKVAKDSLAYILPEFDGLTSASLKVKLSKDTIMSIKWDFTDAKGNPVPEGTYYYCIESSNIKKDSSATPGTIPVTILSESTRGKIVTRQRMTTDGVPTNNIKTLKVAVVPIGSVPISTDATTSATK